MHISQNPIKMDAVSYYNSIKDSYEKLYSREQENKIRFFLSKINIKSNDKILDVGAGSGILESLLSENKITALEPSNMSDIIILKNLSNVSVIKETVQDFNPIDKFDVVFCITVLQDIKEEERDKVIKKLFSLTAENGHLIISVLNVSKIDLSSLNPVNSGYIENDRYFIFFKEGKSFLS